MTHGEKGADRLERNLSPEQMGKIRTNEMQTACEILGCKCVDFYNYHDGGLDQISLEELTQKLIPQIEQYSPQIILTFGQEGISGHRDHIMIGEAVLAAARQAHPRPKEVWLASIAASEIKAFNQHLNERKVHRSHFQESELQGVPDEQLLKIDIKKYAAQKLEALKAHQSQYLPHLVWPTLLKYECFEVVKLP